MAHQIDCPSCGASVRVRRGEISSACSYCGSSVVVPDELRGEAVYTRTAAPPVKGCGAKITVLVALAVLLVTGGAALVFLLAARSSDGSYKASGLSLLTGTSRVELEFGGPGSGRGYFQDPVCITADGHGNIYVGERETGRVQVFDDQGVFLEQWSYSDPDEYYLAAMSSSFDGTLYLVYDSELNIHSGADGEYLGNLRHPDGWGFEDVDVSTDDKVLASWYCNRDDIVLFDTAGDPELIIRGAISGTTGDSELSTTVAAGNSGEIYAYGSFNHVVLVFDSYGTFTDRFGNDEMFTMPLGMDTDPQGRLWISDFGDLLVFSSAGELIRRIETGLSIEDFVIDDSNRLWGITYDDKVVMIDVSEY